jgi:hypothetical protein
MESAIDDIKTIDNMIPGPPVKFSKHSRSFLTNFIGKCKTIFVLLRTLNISQTESRFLSADEPIPKQENYDYIPSTISKSRFMEFAPKRHLHRATVIIKHRTYNFTIMQFENASSAILTDEANHIIKQACSWLLIAHEYAPRNCSNTVNVNLYLTHAKKMLPEKFQDYVDETHANTAFTTSCAKHTTINLFRKEEWFKVFIHETFHNLGLDFSSNAHNGVNAEILRIFRINSEVRLYETYCEMWAEIINIIMRNTSQHIRMLPENIIKHVEQDLQLERAFSLFQTAKLLHHFGIKYSDFLTPNVNVREKYKERTEVFSYFILKSIIMFDVNRFVEWCIANNGNVVGFSNRDGQVMNYARTLILMQHNRRDFLTAIENIEETVFLPKKRIKHVNLMYRTMRMSVKGT